MNLTKNNPSYIVCIGASAGGLEALISFLKCLPKTTNMAYVLIQHLEPQHKSALSEILSRETILNVCEAKNNTKVEAGHVYVISPNTLLAISKGFLKITSRIKRIDGRYLPIDYFMTSLAKDQGPKAVGIILSGTGSDGTLGAKAIKDQGGMVFAQNKITARYFGMPGSVIAGGLADFVLPPDKMGKKLLRLETHEYISSLKPTIKSPDESDYLNRILVLLRDRTGVDFIHYKKNTIGRRIERRMLFHNLKNHADYYNYLKKNPVEVEALRQDILIPVTSFFRDPKLFAAIAKKVFPHITRKRSPQNPLRLWVTACSSGEEVYSLAIFFYEAMEKKQIKPCLQIFGTDLSEMHINKARAGLYTKDISDHVSAERLRRFFVKTETGYKIAKPIRELCIFAKHDITSDPPLSNMDMVSCRNLLIYLDSFLQNKALSTLHYALKPNGFLILGSAESVTAVPNLFTVVDQKQKIYLKNILSRKIIPDMKKKPIILNAPKNRNAAKKNYPKLSPNKPSKVTDFKMQEFDKIILGDTKKDIAKLKKEFGRTVERLNAVNEEKDTFNEELKAANEEVQSSNEELQSMNEELETSKEELQSTNEELLTLNEELQNKNGELLRLNSDLSNVFASTNIPIIIVGNDLCIKRFTPMARKVMNLIATDVERPIGDIKLNIDVPNLEEILRGVIEDMVPKESEVQDKEGRWYCMRLRPYRTLDNKIDGAVMTMIDIDVIKRSNEKIESTLKYTQAIIETMREPLVVLDKDARILSANKSFYGFFKTTLTETENKLLYEVAGQHWDKPELRKLLEDVLPKKSHFTDFEVTIDFPNIGVKTIILDGQQIKMRGQEQPMILLVMEDITKRRKAEDVLKRDSETLEKLVKERTQEAMDLQIKLAREKHLSDLGTMAATVAHELRNTLAGISVAAYNIKKKVNDPKVEGNFNVIDKKILEGDHIINNVLSYSKIKISHLGAVKINYVLELCMTELRNKVVSHGVSIYNQTSLTKDLFIEADSIQIREVFSNILNNAIDAVKKDVGVIDIESKINNSDVTIVIKDNGEGIDKEDLKKVLNPFFTTKANGTGLGLAVCNQIIMLHDGSIAIESEKGKGTIVQVRLPIYRSKTAENDVTP
ncbi:MAG: PAS domain-containing protein [Candidatus Omnitrophica bacterium]|nr:PAS domain-containing protein [Candidatus Omnitrophota bacterium]